MSFKVAMCVLFLYFFLENIIGKYINAEEQTEKTNKQNKKHMEQTNVTKQKFQK